MKRSLVKVIALVFVSVALSQCKTDDARESKTEINYPEEIVKIFKAHGGYDTWAAMQTLEFTLTNGEHQLIDLHSRKVLIEGEKRTIGFDGKDVWVLPDSLTSGARFYHNLYFYFFSMPFVLGDPGITYETVADKELFGMKLSGLKISYGDGVGDSPKDNYILYFDKSSNTMKALMYTVTFKSQEVSDKFNLIKYDEWQEVDGVLLPKKLQWYQYKNDSVGEMRNEAVFTEVSLLKEKPDENSFIRREGTGIDGMH